MDRMEFIRKKMSYFSYSKKPTLLFEIGFSVLSVFFNPTNFPYFLKFKFCSTVLCFFIQVPVQSIHIGHMSCTIYYCCQQLHNSSSVAGYV